MISLRNCAADVLCWRKLRRRQAMLQIGKWICPLRQRCITKRRTLLVLLTSLAEFLKSTTRLSLTMMWNCLARIWIPTSRICKEVFLIWQSMRKSCRMCLCCRRNCLRLRLMLINKLCNLKATSIIKATSIMKVTSIRARQSRRVEHLATKTRMANLRHRAPFCHCLNRFAIKIQGNW